jgi:hypothetical protein
LGSVSNLAHAWFETISSDIYLKITSTKKREHFSKD